MDILEYYKDLLEIDMEQVLQRRATYNEASIKTATKEAIGEKIIKKYNLFDIIFPNNTGFRRITSEKLQKCGCDYEVFFENNTSVYIDLKSLVGEKYEMKAKDYRDNILHDEGKKGVAIEVYQYGIFTNVGKMTDYFLYTICDSDGISYCLIPYDEILRLTKKYVIHMGIFPTEKYMMQYSFNGTGIYIKYPVDVSFLFKKKKIKKIKAVKS